MPATKWTLAAQCNLPVNRYSVVWRIDMLSRLLRTEVAPCSAMGLIATGACISDAWSNWWFRRIWLCIERRKVLWSNCGRTSRCGQSIKLHRTSYRQFIALCSIELDPVRILEYTITQISRPTCPIMPFSRSRNWRHQSMVQKLTSSTINSRPLLSVWRPRACWYLYFVITYTYILRCVQYLPARRRPQGLVVIGVCLSVCLSVCAHSFCPQDIPRTGSWITTKFGGWEQGVNL